MLVIYRCGSCACAPMWFGAEVEALTPMCLWAMINESKHTEASFFADFDRSAGLQVAQMPKSLELVTFVPITPFHL